MRCSTLSLFPRIASQVSHCHFPHFSCVFLSARLCSCLSFYPSLFPVNAEYGLLRLVRRSHHPAGVPGGEEGSGLLRSQGAAADEGQQQPERGAPAAPEGGREYGSGGMKGRAVTNQAKKVNAGRTSFTAD